VILDSRLRSPLTAAVFSPDAPTYVMTTAHVDHQRKRLALAARHIAVRNIRPGPAGLDIPAVLHQLRTEGIRSVIVEGGARVITSMLAAGVVDRVIVSISPRIFGRGTDAVGELHNQRIADALRLNGHTVHLIGATIIVAAGIADPSGLPPDARPPADTGHA
jgi:riboflavin-specific deaminase-like protein